MFWDYFRLAYQSVKRRKLRSWLTMIGIFIGVTAVVSLISLGQGLQDSINEEFKKIGSNRIIISPGSGTFGPVGSSLAVGKLTEKDLEVVRGVLGVDYASGVFSKTAKVKYRDEVQFLSTWGIPVDAEGRRLIEGVHFFDIKEGRQLKSGDKYKVVLGSSIAAEAFEKEIFLDSKVEINGHKFEVVGVQKKAGTGVHDNILRIPLETAREIFSEPEEVSSIFVFTQPTVNPLNLVEEIKKELREFREVEEGEEDFSVQTAEQTIGQLNQVLGVVKLFLIGIAAISLIVGGIGIMNTMYTTVLERTREIGIMKAVGAKGGQILFLFLIEAGLLGLVGGVIGLVLGYGLAKLGEGIALSLGTTLLKIHFDLTLVMGALLFSFLVGIISGLMPARQASLLVPVEALRRAK